jgi:hypothetical protein
MKRYLILKSASYMISMVKKVSEMVLKLKALEIFLIYLEWGEEEAARQVQALRK